MHFVDKLENICQQRKTEASHVESHYTATATVAGLVKLH